MLPNVPFLQLFICIEPNKLQCNVTSHSLADVLSACDDGALWCSVVCYFWGVRFEAHIPMPPSGPPPEMDIPYNAGNHNHDFAAAPPDPPNLNPPPSLPTTPSSNASGKRRASDRGDSSSAAPPSKKAA